jgi:hypothetical protein
MMRNRHGKGAIIGFAQLICLLLLTCPLWVAASGVPDVTSVFPLGGHQGSTFRAEIRGQNLDKTYAVWFDCDDLKADVKGIELVQPEAKDAAPNKGQQEEKKQQQRVFLEVVIRPQAKVGAHALRVITPRGVSGPLAIQVNSEPVISETLAAHNAAAQAQALNSPVIVNGRISEPGKVDYYEIKAEKGQELMFEVITGSGLFPAVSGIFRVPQLTLYEPSGSWFDPNRIARLEPHDESLFMLLPKRLWSSYPIPGTEQYLPRLTYRVAKTMTLVAGVSGFEGQGGPDYCYELRIAPVKPSSGPEKWTPRVLAHDIDYNLEERDFTRRIGPDWLEKISSRTVEARNSYKVSLFQEKEPNDEPAQAAEITIPALIEGVVARPQDTDCFKFQVKAGRTLAFEIETPNREPPYFNPRLAIRDQSGQELVTNIYRKVAGDGDDWVKTVEPKTVYTFGRAGTYYLQVSDLVNRDGNPNFRYRILVRPQIPHMGKIAPKTFGIVGTETEEDRVNLLPGEAKKWAVISEEEEGFDGEFAISIENLPPGVQAFAAAAMERELPSQGGQVYETRGAVHKEYYRPQRLTTTMLLLARPDAPPTRMPQMIRLVATPILKGKAGAPHTVQEYPLMVAAPTEPSATKQLKERADATLKQK